MPKSLPLVLQTLDEQTLSARSRAQHSETYGTEGPFALLFVLEVGQTSASSVGRQLAAVSVTSVAVLPI
jgi:hypothetical protein